MYILHSLTLPDWAWNGQVLRAFELTYLRRYWISLRAILTSGKLSSLNHQRNSSQALGEESPPLVCRLVCVKKRSYAYKKKKKKKETCKQSESHQHERRRRWREKNARKERREASAISKSGNERRAGYLECHSAHPTTVCENYCCHLPSALFLPFSSIGMPTYTCVHRCTRALARLGCTYM